MTLIDLIIEEFDFEMANTRMTLELIPHDKFNWRPHDKSYSFAQLGMHLGDILNLSENIASGNSFNTGTGEIEKVGRKTETYNDILNNFDKKSAKAHHSLLKLSDEELTQSWTLLSGQEILFTLPKYFVIRQFIINHSIHHRAQLTVYLRLNDVSLPNLYGQTGDGK